MKRVSVVSIVVALILAAGPVAESSGYQMSTTVQSNPSQVQNTQAIGGGNAVSSSNSDSVAWAGGGSAYSEGSDSSAVLFYAPTSISKYKTRVAPLTTYPPYLPMWNHGGWGTIKAYFPNGPTSHDRVYERVFDPTSEEDMYEVRGILRSLSYNGPLEVLGGVLNGVTTLFGGPDRYHHGRGFEIANSVIRDRRPAGKPLLVFIDSYVDPLRLEEEGYAYVGRLSLEGNANRNWDQVYNAAVAETLPWDVDLLLISGGMKGVTVGATTSLSGGGGYSQANYSLSLLGGQTKGVTEGKGKAVMSATAYRYCPEMLDRRQIPSSLYDRIRVRPQTAAAVSGANGTAPQQAAAMPTAASAGAPAPAEAARDQEYMPSDESAGPNAAGVDVSQNLYRMAFPL
ncbi:hypothetical protein [Anaerobaca lacustris]|uniref:Uncharacterized protein n=1 Tax=Anaerobaca lacustris TaxID=3044600 RepID=A0AAW6TSZ6_9BACT|nr:hypothetical protein [Sedimentisphaerales bacterium M17dextr]